MTRRVVRRPAPAKLNLFLRVLRARRDGYHEIESLVVPLSLADRVTVRRADALRLDLRGAEPQTSQVPAGGGNLALIAALALAEVCMETAGADIEIEKRIPVAAGLGGGSADAAAVLVSLNELWGCGLGGDGLVTLAARIGSDVPAMLAGEPVLVRGRGERVEPITIAPTWWVVVPLDFRVRAPHAYRWWDEDRARPGPKPTQLVAAAKKGNLEHLGSLLFNDLEAPVAKRHPQVAETKERLLEAGALGATMSGSGPTLVALARDPEHARRLAHLIPGSLLASAPR